jgi:hypothetical protein
MANQRTALHGTGEAMSHEIIRLGGAIELQVLEHGTLEGQAEGDLRLKVSVRMDDFAGAYAGVWIARDDWRAFITSLRTLEHERRGEASLIAMSPDKFELHLEIIDRAGHLAAHGFLSRYHFRPNQDALRSRIEYYVDVDPSLLRELVGSFSAWYQDPSHRVVGD